MKIDAREQDFEKLNRIIAESDDLNVEIDNCLGERFIAAGNSNKSFVLNGIPGNALGAYLNGGKIVVNGNVQDAVGDTMNNGEIVVFGNAGDALGYAMRGGEIYVKGKSGYRTGVHIKEYGEQKSVIVIGETAGSFLGEYQAGGLIIVLNLNDEKQVLGNYPSTGIHGGCVYVRTAQVPDFLPEQALCERIETLDEQAKPYVKKFADYFGIDCEKLFNDTYMRIKPNSNSPYKKMYVAN